jgi:rhomboid protease GluP
MASYPPHSGFPTHPPEILPPEDAGSAAQQEELRAVRERLPGQRSQSGPRSWAYAPATYLLVGINCAVYLGMVLTHVSFVNPSIDDLLRWGANNSTAVLYYGEWWRVVTAMFVHVGILHLATNMWCLWNLGLLGEPLIGPVGVFAAYVLSGAAGNLLSIGVASFYRHDSVGAGASGAVFGIAGVLIVLLKSPRLPIPPKELAGLRRYVIYFAAINFVIGFGGNQLNLGVNIDNMAHLGGFLGGIIFALPLVPLLGSPKSLFFFRRRLAVGLVSALLVFFGFYLSAVFPGSSGPLR